MSEDYWHQLHGLIGTALGHFRWWRFNLHVLSDTLQMPEWTRWKNVSTELHESLDGVLAIMSPLEILIGAAVILINGVVNHDSVLRASLDSGLDASDPVLVLPGQLKRVVVISRPKEEGH